jgi:CBS domain-containing protein
VRIRESLVSDRVTQLDQSALLVVPPGATVREAIALMRKHRAGCVLVCEEKRLRGIFTERDLLTRVFARDADLDARVDAFMTADPVAIHLTDNVALVIRQMLEGGYRHLPIVDEHGGAVGVVSVRGLIHYLVEYFPTTVYNLPPVPGQAEPSREGA